MSNKTPPRRPSVTKILAASILSASTALGLWLYLDSNAVDANNPSGAQLTASLNSMRDAPEDYLSTERDGAILLNQLREGGVDAIAFENGRIMVLTMTGKRYFVNDSRGVLTAPIVKAVQDAGERAPAISFFDKANEDVGLTVIMRFTANMLMFLLYGLLIVLAWRLYKDFKKGGHQPLVDKVDVRFGDVIGVDEAKASLQDVVQYLREPQRYTALGARPPSGVLLLGGPGVGKTLLAKALAGECGASFINASGSDFTSKYVGVGVQKVKSLFETARKCAPCIVFIDEIDGIARRTNGSGSAAESENNRIINQVLVEMDGFGKNEGVVVIGATNLAENLDEALLREGRFDRQVQVKLPDMIDRARVLEHYAKNIKLDQKETIDYQQLARLTTGFSPATLAYVINNAALISARHNLDSVRMPQLLESIETAHMGELNGAQRALTDTERRRIAAHEAGHAIVAAATGCGVVEKVTILPRGGALGVTLVTQQQDKMLHLRSDMENRIMMLLAGRNAELSIFGEASSGAAHDLQECSKVAMSMVSRFGFGERGSLFNIDALPKEHAGPYVKDSIEEAKRLLDKLNTSCQALLKTHAQALLDLTDELLEVETVSGERVMELTNRINIKEAA